LFASVSPPGFNFSDNFFDLSSAVFHGPFKGGDWTQVEQRQSDKPKFWVLWNLSN
jgi:hypothetical protein